MKKQKMRIAGPLLIISAAVIWGLSFVIQSEGTKYIGTFTFCTVRCILAALFLLPINLVRAKVSPALKQSFHDKKQRKDIILGSVCVGTMLCIGINFQQYAFEFTAPGKVGFITALYMLLVPIFSVFLKMKPPITVWLGVIVGLAGLYLLCVGFTTSFGAIGKGEIVALIGAVAFALHIMVIDRFARRVDNTVLSCGQFIVAGAISAVFMLIFEQPNIHNILNASLPLLYTGILSSGVAFTFQIIGQKYTEPTVASLFLCLESVFSVFFSFVILHTQMSFSEYLGCGIMFVGIVIAQIRPKKLLRR